MNSYPIGIAVGQAMNGKSDTKGILITIAVCVVLIGIIIWQIYKE